MTQLCGQKNEVGFKCQRSLLRWASKPVAFLRQYFHQILDTHYKGTKKEAPSKFA